MRAEDILPKALELPTDERSRLAALLLDSIEDGQDEEDVEEAWLDEITRRLDEHENGAVQTIPADVALSRARDRLKRARG
jgi:putative addiction module component (TIGR02574 family)